MDNSPKKEENDFGCSLNFKPDLRNPIDEVEVDKMAKILTINSLKNKGYINDAFNIMLDLDSNKNNNISKIN